MARPSKLTPAQWNEVHRRLAEGEGVRKLAAEFGVSPATICKGGVSKQTERVQKVAQKLADAQTSLAELPVRQQHMAVNLADKLRNISTSLASAAELGAATAHRLNALANTEVAKVDDVNPLESIDNLKSVGVLTKLANESAHVALNLLNANKEAVKDLNSADRGDDDAPDLAITVRRRG